MTSDFGPVESSSSGRPNSTNKLLAVLVAVLGVTVIVLLFRGRDAVPAQAGAAPVLAEDPTPVVKAGEKASPPAARPVPPAKPLDDAGRIRESLEPSRSYRVVQKVGTAFRGQLPEQGSDEVVKIGLACELVYTRTVESNDGYRVTEVRQYDGHRVVALRVGAADFSIDIGPPDQPVLEALPGFDSRELSRVEDVKPVIQAVVKGDARAIAADPNTRVLGQRGPLQGKKVRLTWADGKGVIAVEPIGCDLNGWERDYFFSKDPLIYSRMLLNLDLSVGGSAKIPGWLFSEVLEQLDPEPLPKVGGHVTVRRDADADEGGGRYAVLTIHEPESELRMEESGRQGKVIGTFRPGGRLTFKPGERYVRTAILDGAVRLESIPAGSPLHKALPLEEAKLRFTYSCQKR